MHPFSLNSKFALVHPLRLESQLLCDHLQQDFVCTTVCRGARDTEHNQQEEVRILSRIHPLRCFRLLSILALTNLRDTIIHPHLPDRVVLEIAVSTEEL